MWFHVEKKAMLRNHVGRTKLVYVAKLGTGGLQNIEPCRNHSKDNSYSLSILSRVKEDGSGRLMTIV